MTHVKYGMNGVDDDRRQLKQIMTEKPMTRQQHDALQRHRVEQRRHLEDISQQKRLQSTQA